MDLPEIEARIKKIKEKAGDDEIAHGLEDDLYGDFVKYVSEKGNKKLSEMAKAILETKNIGFARWCA